MCGSPVIVTVFCDFLVNGLVNLLLPSSPPVIIAKFPAHATKAETAEEAGVCTSGTGSSVVLRGKPKVRLKPKKIPGAGSERKKGPVFEKCVVTKG